MQHATWCRTYDGRSAGSSTTSQRRGGMTATAYERIPEASGPADPTALDLMDWALAYAKAGTAVFPCKWWPGSGSKAPLVPPPGFHLATTDAHQIADWWIRGPTHSSAHPYPTPAAPST